MSTVTEIIKAAQRLNADQFLKLRTALDRIEEQIWEQELEQVSIKHRTEGLSDANIDELVLRRRYRGRQG